MCEHASDSYESDAEERTEIMLYDTGGGYLVFGVRKEYHRLFEEWFPVGWTLLGLAEIEDEAAIRESFRELDLDLGTIERLPELPLDGEEVMNQADSE